MMAAYLQQPAADSGRPWTEPEWLATLKQPAGGLAIDLNAAQAELPCAQRSSPLIPR